MGIGTSMKETTLHYYRDPLVEVLSEDRDVNLRGILIVGSPDKNEDKYLSAERVGVSLECMRVDGAVFSCNGIGNNHVDYAHAIEETEKRGVPTAVLSQCPAKDFVVQNDHLDAVVCYYKSLDRMEGMEMYWHSLDFKFRQSPSVETSSTVPAQESIMRRNASILTWAGIFITISPFTASGSAVYAAWARTGDSKSKTERWSRSRSAGS